MIQLAEYCEALISMGHGNPFDYTPRQLIAFVSLADRRKSANLLNDLYIGRAAHHADDKAIRKIERDLNRGR